ncbi:MAG TPA: ATPase, partial [Clostridiales bacterium]|nr:ATPase [Clostridiales bacterium]
MLDMMDSIAKNILQPFHVMAQNEVLQKLNTEASGLTEEEASRRLKQYGSNRMAQVHRRSLVLRIFDQLLNVMVLILSIAAIISLIVGDVKSTAIIAFVIIMNTVLGVIQESRAEKALEALKNLASPEAEVRREGKARMIRAEDLTIGDIVILEAGDHVPADMRIIEAANLKIEEAALTGESVPVEKTAEVLPAEQTDVVIGDRRNMAYLGSSVTYGRAAGVVTATGMQTETGKIAGFINTQDQFEETPLQKKLAEMSKYISIIIIVVSAVIFVTGLLWGRSFFDMFLTSVSLAVAAIPEGLPAIVTIVLALGVQKMARKKAIIRKLPAVETLGSTEVICSDKTGTLTKNEMTVTMLYHSHASFSADRPDAIPSHLIHAMILCNDTRVSQLPGSVELTGDPTETALVRFAQENGMNKSLLDKQFPRTAEIAFDSSRKLMTTVHQTPGGTVSYTKGALDILLDRSNRILDGEGVREMMIADREAIQKVSREMSGQALRVLAFGFQRFSDLPADMDHLENDLIFTGFVGMIDPPRPEAKAAVQICRDAGIKPVMITGDHLETAAAIARQLGILSDNDSPAEGLTGSETVEGRMLERMSDEELLKRVQQFSVYARVSPEHKVRIVQAWRKLGRVTAMTGDGVNDAPALKAADIGIGMGITGTDVAKGVADMVLADDNFATIVSAVEEGRRIFSNIRKAVHFLLSTHLGEVFALFIATLLNWEILYPIHLLWVNLIIDTLPALALGMEKPEDNIMRQKPRKSDTNFFAGGLGANIIVHGIMKGFLVLITFIVARSIHSQEIAMTAAFTTLGLVQLAHAFTLRSEYKPIWKMPVFTNKPLIFAASVSALLQIIVVVLPGLNNIFKVVQLKWEEW